MDGKKNSIVYDDFVVLNTLNARVYGLVDGNFTKSLYNPSGIAVIGSIPVTVSELGDGVYRVNYTPNLSGLWTLNVFHSTYFPEGKTSNYNIYDNDIDSVGSSASISTILDNTIKQLNGIDSLSGIVIDVRTQTNKMNFTGTDIKATLDGETIILTDDSITSAKFDEITAFPIKLQDTGVTKIARTGESDITLTSLSGQIESVLDYTKLISISGVIDFFHLDIIDQKLDSLSGVAYNTYDDTQYIRTTVDSIETYSRSLSGMVEGVDINTNKIDSVYVDTQYTRTKVDSIKSDTQATGGIRGADNDDLKDISDQIESIVKPPAISFDD